MIMRGMIGCRRFARLLVDLGRGDQRPYLDRLHHSDEGARHQPGEDGGEEDASRQHGGQWQGKAKASRPSFAALCTAEIAHSPVPKKRNDPSSTANMTGPEN